MRRGLVIGCGGTVGAAWAVGALAALDWDPREAEVMVGTSAGAEFVTLLGAGVPVADLLDAHLRRPGARPELVAHLDAAPGRFPPAPSPRPGAPGWLTRRDLPAVTRLSGLLPEGRGDAQWLADLAARFAPDGWVEHPNAWVVAVDRDSGRRVAFGSPGAPPADLRDAIRASWAIPGWFPPVEIAGRHYLDGGVHSPTSADLLVPLGLDEVVVLAPMASTDPGRARGAARVERLLRRAMTRSLDAEVAALRAAGTRVLRLEPGPVDLAAMGPNLMDATRAARALETALRTTKSTVEES